MTWIDAVIAFCIGAIGFVVAYLVMRVGSAAHVAIRHREAFERITNLAQQLVRAKSEVVLLEIAIDREAREANDTTRIKFAEWSRNMADALPPLFLQQLRRFGLAEPPLEVPSERSRGASVDEAFVLVAPETVVPATEATAATGEANAWSEEP